MIYTVPIQTENKTYRKVLMHEHIQCLASDLLRVFGKKWMDEAQLIELASDVLAKLKKTYQVDLFVDGTPIDLGRNVRVLQEVSCRSGVDIVASSGLYCYPDCFTSGNSAEEIASWFIYEFTHGMEGTGLKPGILKCATDACGITDDNRKRLKALMIAQKETGLPLYVHSNHKNNIVMDQLAVLREIGTADSKIVIGHAAQRPETDYLKRILDLGCYVAVDQCHCTKYSCADIGRALTQLCDAGYGDRILLSNDLCIYTDFGTREQNGLSRTADSFAKQFGYLFTSIFEAFRNAGGNVDHWNKMTGKNPVELLTIV